MVEHGRDSGESGHMELRFTEPAQVRMAWDQLDIADVEAVLRRADWTLTGLASVEYRATVGDRRIAVVVVRGSDPPLVMSVSLVRRQHRGGSQDSTAGPRG